MRISFPKTTESLAMKPVLFASGGSMASRPSELSA